MLLPLFRPPLTAKVFCIFSPKPISLRQWIACLHNSVAWSIGKEKDQQRYWTIIWTVSDLIVWTRFLDIKSLDSFYCLYHNSIQTHIQWCMPYKHKVGFINKYRPLPWFWTQINLNRRASKLHFHLQMVNWIYQIMQTHLCICISGMGPAWVDEKCILDVWIRIVGTQTYIFLKLD